MLDIAFLCQDFTIAPCLVSHVKKYNASGSALGTYFYVQKDSVPRYELIFLFFFSFLKVTKSRNLC